MSAFHIFALTTNISHSLGPKSALILGVSPQHKGHKCLDPTGRIYISKDVLFNEYRFPYQQLFPDKPEPQLSSPTPLILVSISLIIDVTQSVPTTPATSIPKVIPENSDFVTHSQPATSPIDTQPIAPVVTNNHPMVTRTKTGNLKPKVFLAHTEPNSVKEALSHPDWFAAMQAKFEAFQNIGTWSLVELPPNKTAIGCKWVFRVKENPPMALKTNIKPSWWQRVSTNNMDLILMRHFPPWLNL